MGLERREKQELENYTEENFSKKNAIKTKKKANKKNKFDDLLVKDPKCI